MELKVKEYLSYQANYCGICLQLRDKYGQIPRLILSYDMTFVAILLNGLYELKEEQKQIRCLFHPTKKRMVVTTDASKYAADMNLLLAYHNLKDDWVDDHDIKSLSLAKMLERKYQKVVARYPRQAKSVEDYIKQLSICEAKADEDHLDLAANLTGRMFGEILVWKEDAWSITLRNLGFSLGKFIYYMDAYEDLEEDRKSGSYNPLLGVSETFIEDILAMLMAEVARNFEYLPILEYEQILRNILYSGVWIKYQSIKEKRKQREGENA